VYKWEDVGKKRKRIKRGVSFFPTKEKKKQEEGEGEEEEEEEEEEDEDQVRLGGDMENVKLDLKEVDGDFRRFYFPGVSYGTLGHEWDQKKNHDREAVRIPSKVPVRGGPIGTLNTHTGRQALRRKEGVKKNLPPDSANRVKRRIRR